MIHGISQHSIYMQIVVTIKLLNWLISSPYIKNNWPHVRGLVSVLQHRHMFQAEGIRAFYKGLGPTLVGIAPTRALYFFTYDKAKRSLNGVLTPNSHQVHMAAAFIGGVFTATVTSPIWVVKTRLQLDSQARKRFTLGRCIRQVFAENGLRGFYRGLSASYAGTAETALCFVLYENMKMRLQAGKPYYTTGQLDPKDFILAATSSKMIATVVCYPHEVVRTRMRQRVSPWEQRYRSLVQTVITVWKEEGRQGLYGGMSAHLARVIPNTAILFLTYESVIRLLNQSS